MTSLSDEALSSTDVDLCKGYAQLGAADLNSRLWIECASITLNRNQTLVNASIDMAKELEMVPFLQSITYHVCRQIRADRCTVYVYDKDSGSLVRC